jgi:beta-glucosidase
MLADAVKIAGESDMAIIFAGLSDHFEGEGRDRNFLILENQDRLIRKVQEVNPKTVVVMITGTPPIIEAWADRVPAIVQAWFGGQEGGNAIADILLGNSNPGGKLPCSFYRRKEDSAGFHDYRNPNFQSVYKERIYVGYRYLDFHNIKPRFPFGHGLSYSRFEYDHPRIIQQEGDDLEIAFSVANHGKMSGSEVAQIYVKPLTVEMEKPEKELKAFKKVFLLPGQQKEIRIILGKSAFSYFNSANEKWEINRGHYDILIGSSSEDIREVIKAYPVGL